MTDLLRILIVEDDDGMRRMFPSLLGPLKRHFPDAKIEAVATKADALLMLSHDSPRFDAAVIDLHLPDSPIVRDTIAWIASLNLTVPCVVITGRASDEECEVIRAMGVDVIRKQPPGFFDKLCEMIVRAILRGKQERSRQLIADCNRLAVIAAGLARTHR